MKRKIEQKLENWLINKCQRTAWRNPEGLVLYEGEFITDTFLTPGANYSVVTVYFYAPSRRGMEYMRRAIAKGARTAYAIHKDLLTFATFGKQS